MFAKEFIAPPFILRLPSSRMFSEELCAAPRLSGSGQLVGLCRYGSGRQLLAMTIEFRLRGYLLR